MKIIRWAWLSAALALSTAAQTRILRVPYHNWPEAYFLSNGKVEAIIVPAIGRVMQFRFVAEEDGPFWENREMDGKAPDSNSTQWGNFGGDKSWPSPQADWPKMTGRAWPPPKAFDSMPLSVVIDKDQVILTSSIDTDYGIKTRRVVSLTPHKAEMVIVTEYNKVLGNPVKAGIWIITQLKDPREVLALLPPESIFPQSYIKQSDLLPQGLSVASELLQCSRSPKFSSKIGTDASQLIWAGEKLSLWIQSPRMSAKIYPDNGSSAEIYTNPDPLKYVELEMLGPVAELKKGDHLSQTNSYRLYAVGSDGMKDLIAEEKAKH